MNNLIQDVRYGIRMLLKSPGFTGVAILTLALGIGANTSIFSLINAVLLRPLPFEEPDRLVMVWERRSNSGETNIPVSGHEFIGWRERSRAFESLAIIQPDVLILTGRGEPETLNVWRVSADFFSVLGVQPLLGRTFLTGEDQAGSNKIAVLKEGLWKRRFGADPDIVGKSITLSDQSYTVVGVMPSLDLMPDVWMPIDLIDEQKRVGKHSNNVIGRLGSGVTLVEAQADLKNIAHQLEQQYPDNNTDHSVGVIALHEFTVGNVQGALLVLFGAVGFVLLIACANVANLLLTRAAARQKEIAIRMALGAGRARLVRQLLTESLLLAVVGGGVGLLLAMWVIDLLPLIKAVNIPRLDQVSIDGGVLAMTVGLSLFTGILTGMAPALRSSRPNLSQSLNEGTRASASLGRRRIGSLLVILEIALALVLLVGGGLMIKSFIRLVNVEPGFDPHNVLRLGLTLPGPRYPQVQQQRVFYQELIERIKALPGVESVGATTRTPLGGTASWLPVSIEGRPAPPPGQEPYVADRTISSDYFRAMRIPLRRGRYFTEADARRAVPVIRWFEQQPYPEHFDEPQPEPVIIINETMAQMFWPGEDPLGRRVRLIASPWFTVVGVVGDIRHGSLNSQPYPEMYLSHLQEPQESMAVMIRTANDPLNLATAVREQIKELDKDQPVAITTMGQIFSDSVGGQRFNALLLGIFGALALALAMVGVFGVINYSVAGRTHEIGVRIALGAQPKDILRLVVGQGLTLAVAGVGIGLVGAFALTHLITGLLYGVSPTDLWTYVIVSLLLTGVALLASYIPARRAVKVDPIVALRYE
jgi:putative ABC transport system permease protein